MATEENAARPEPDDTPELLLKLRERKERHKQRIIMSGPGVPGPGIATIVIGLGFLALEFDWAERLLERAIIWGDQVKDRAEETSTKQRIIAGIASALAVAAFVAAAILWDIPLLPIV